MSRPTSRSVLEAAFGLNVVQDRSQLFVLVPALQTAGTGAGGGGGEARYSTASTWSDAAAPKVTKGLQHSESDC